MGQFMDKAEQFADDHDEQVDKAVDRAGEEVDERTGGEHGEQIDKAVDAAQERTGEGDSDQ